MRWTTTFYGYIEQDANFQLQQISLEDNRFLLCNVRYGEDIMMLWAYFFDKNVLSYLHIFMDYKNWNFIVNRAIFLKVLKNITFGT